MQQKRDLGRTGRFSNGIAPHAMRGAAEAVARANGHLPPGTGQSLDALFVCAAAEAPSRSLLGAVSEPPCRQSSSARAGAL